MRLDTLNEAQKTAVLHTEGPLLILAGAGSGKTTTMAHRIAYLMSVKHVPPTGILGLSFTRKAAKELKERVEGLAKKTHTKTKGMTVGTFHSFCVRILKAHADRLGYQVPFSILDSNDQLELIRELLKKLKIDEKKFEAETVRFEISQAKNRFLEPDQAYSYFESRKNLPYLYVDALQSIYEQYIDRLKTLNAFDFDDLIFQTAKLLKNNLDVRESLQNKLLYIMVDEYQDTNPAQFELLRLIINSKSNLCVVGDDDQSIYAWRGAEPKLILEFQKYYPTAKCITLDQNYRSTQSILDSANRVIEKNTERFDKKLWSDQGEGEPLIEIVVHDDRTEGEVVGDEILKRMHDPRFSRTWSDFAILFRSNTQSRIFEESMRLRRIPYQIVGGMSFLDRKEVKDVLSYLRFIVNPHQDLALRRAICWPARGIGKASIQLLSDFALQNGVSFYTACETETITAQLPTKARTALQGFMNLLKNEREQFLNILKDSQSIQSFRELLSQTLLKTFERLEFKTHIFDEEDDPIIAQRKWDNIAELSNALGQMQWEDPQPADGLQGLSQFVETMTLDPSQDDESEDTRAQVTLMTLHSAKGLEFSIVFLVGVEEGYLPHQRTIDMGQEISEERRLCYVGMTRAKKELILTRAKDRIRYGKKVPRAPSRFLLDIPPHLKLLQDESNPANLPELHQDNVKGFLASIREKLEKQG